MPRDLPVASDQRRARALLDASPDSLELLVRELEEFRRNGTELVDALKEATSW